MVRRRKPRALSPRYPPRLRWVLAWSVGACLAAAALVGVLYLYGRETPPALGAVPDAVLATLTTNVPAIAVAFIALAALAWCFRQLSLDWLAWRSGRISVATFTAGSPLPDVDLAQLTMRFRQELSNLHLQAPSPVPGAASDGDFLEVLSRGSVDPRNVLGSLVTLGRAAKPTHAWEVSGVVSARADPPRCGVTVQVLRLPGQASSPQTVWANSWEEALRRAANHATATILPRTNMCRAPWASWRRFVMCGELFEAFEHAAWLEEQRRYDEALDAYYEALGRDPMNMAIRLRIGQLQEKLALHLDALATYQAMREIDRREKRPLRLEWWRYRPQTRSERRQALHTAAYRRVVLLGGADLVDQWRRTADAGARWTARDHRREELRRRLRRQLDDELGAVAVRRELDATSVEDLLASPLPAATGRPPDDKEDRLRCELRELFALAGLRALRRLKRQARRHWRTTPTSAKALRLTALCIDVRLASVRKLHAGEPEWVYPRAEIDRRIRPIRRFGLRRWHDQYNAACAYALPLLAASSDDHAERALHRLARATASADSAYIASRRDWLVIEDPDLDGLRTYPGFKYFEAVYFPGEAPTALRPRRVHQLENARYVQRLLLESAQRWEDTWHARGRELGSGRDIHEMLRWWDDECAAWKLVRHVAVDHRDWRARVGLVSAMRDWSAAYGFEPLRVSFGRYEDDPLPSPDHERRGDRQAATAAVLAAQDRLARLRDALPDRADVEPAIALLREIEFWQSTLRGFDAAAREPRRQLVAQLCDHHAALWQRLHEWLASEVGTGDDAFATAFAGQVAATSALWRRAGSRWRRPRLPQLNVSSASSIVAAPAAHARRAAAPRRRGQPSRANAPSVSTATVLPSQR